MSNLIPLSNCVMQRLADLHGSPEKAQAFRMRSLMPERPADGSGTRQERVIVVNDLHVGAGRDPQTGKYDPADDFTNDQTRQLISYLAREWGAAKHGDPTLLHPTRATVYKELSKLTWADGAPIDPRRVGAGAQQEPRPYHLSLCINGDFVDFLQTTLARPGFPYPDGMSKGGVAPRNTPANAIVQLNMIRAGHPELFRALAMHVGLGHDLVIIPGNHDRHLYNDHVWSGGVVVEGKRFGGLLDILAEELRSLGASPDQTRAALVRVRRQPFAVWGDKWVDHGDMGDRHNRIQRPYQEIFAKTGLHDEMPMAIGDYGVRGGFNAIEVLDPLADAHVNLKSFLKHSLRHPIESAKLALAFVRGFCQEGHTVSKQADAEQRLADMRQLVDRFPMLVEQLNALRAPEDRLSKDEVVNGLCEIEKASSTPLFSNFKRGSGLFTRLAVYVKDQLLGRYDDRSKDEVYQDRLAVMSRELGVTEVVHGHTHRAKDAYFVTPEEKLVRYVNTHTWMTKEGDWGRPSITWGTEGRGVGIIEVGVDSQGKPWSHLSLMKVIDEHATLVEGDILEDAQCGGRQARKDVRRAEEVWASNRAHRERFETETKPTRRDESCCAA